MKIRSQVLCVLAACALLGLGVSHCAAAVSDDDFNSLKNSVQQLGEKMKKLEEVHDQDKRTHEQDQLEIQKLKQQLGETQKTATDAQEKATAASQIQAVHPLPGEGNAAHNFTMVGDAEIQFGKIDGQHSGFAMADFAPIFLWRARDNVLFEAGMDIKVQNNTPGSGGSSTSLGISFAQLDYIWNDYSTFVGGYMLLPLGTYSERSAGWLNKIPDDPLARDFLQSAGAGAQLRGAVPVGESGHMFTYSAYGANGPSSVDGSGNWFATNGSPNLDLGGNVGLDSNGDFTGNAHSSPSGGGRLGWFFPLKPHYDLELGLSGQTGYWDNSENRMWSALVVDASLHVSPYFEFKGEYIHTWVETDDMGTVNPRGWWVQAGYKLAGLKLELPVINNVELVARYDEARDGVTFVTDRFTLGYVYYFSSSLWLEGAYEFQQSDDPSQDHNKYVFQLSYGF